MNVLDRDDVRHWLNTQIMLDEAGVDVSFNTAPVETEEDRQLVVFALVGAIAFRKILAAPVYRCTCGQLVPLFSECHRRRFWNFWRHRAARR